MSQAPAALYWYRQQPDALGYRNSSANSTGPWTSATDPTGQPGVFNLVKYVPEETVAAAVVAEGISEYERGLRDGAVLERKKVAQLVAALAAIKQITDGSQPIDAAGAAMVAESAIAQVKATP